MVLLVGLFPYNFFCSLELVILHNQSVSTMPYHKFLSYRTCWSNKTVERYCFGWNLFAELIFIVSTPSSCCQIWKIENYKLILPIASQYFLLSIKVFFFVLENQRNSNINAPSKLPNNVYASGRIIELRVSHLELVKTESDQFRILTIT